jgi:hypothetical protein
MTRFMTREEYRGSIGLSSGLRMVSPLELEPVFASHAAFYVGFGPSAAVFGVTQRLTVQSIGRQSPETGIAAFF